MSHDCPTCGDEFDTERGVKMHHSVVHGEKLREKSTCNQCGDEFSVHRNAPGKYCSRECVSAARSEKEQRECEMCNREFSAEPSSKVRYCCHECFEENRINRPRPDDVDALLWLLYTYEGFNLEKTYRRQRAVLGNDNRLHKTDVHERIRELGLTRQREYWTLQDTDPEDVGLSSNPAGDESYKEYYPKGQQAD